MITVDGSEGVILTASWRISKRCPHRDEIDEGNIKISWDTSHGSLELHSVRDFLLTWTDKAVSHEEITATVAEKIFDLLGGAVVTTNWVTAGAEVTCHVVRGHAEWA